jgi:hypothetical protein
MDKCLKSESVLCYLCIFDSCFLGFFCKKRSNFACSRNLTVADLPSVAGIPVPECRDPVLGSKTLIFVTMSLQGLFSFQSVLRTVSSCFGRDKVRGDF